MTLAIFDLDNTLLAGDSDYLWGQFLVEEGLVDGDAYAEHNARFYREYQQGTLDIEEYLSFALAPLARYPAEDLHRWRERFVEEKIRPIMLDKARQLVADHQSRGHTTLVITATNHFVTSPIVQQFGIPHILATLPEFADGRYTGQWLGTPCFQHGKVICLNQWLAETGHTLEGSWFYSDSHNDIPLLEKVTHPIAVDPDAQLTARAQHEGWPIISLR